MPEQKEITCWEDAGNWDPPGSLALTSVKDRIEAIRKAAAERQQFCFGTVHKDIANPFPVLSPVADTLYKLRSQIIRLIPEFIRIRDDVIAAVTLTESDGTSHSFTDISMEDEVCTVPLTYGTLKFSVKDGKGIFSSEETCYIGKLKDRSGTVYFQPFSAEALLEEFPLDVHRLHGLGVWMQNAYTVLNLLQYPFRRIALGCIGVQDRTNRKRGFELYTAEDGQTVYYVNGEEFYGTTPPAETEIWHQAEWYAESSGLQSYAVRRKYENESFPYSSGLFCTRISVERNCCSATGQNNTMTYHYPDRIMLPDTVEMQYQKCCQPYYSGDTFLSDGIPENQWITLFDGTLNPDEPFDSSGTSVSAEIMPGADGTYGSNCDGQRKRILSHTIDFRSGSPFAFTAAKS